MSSKGQQQDLVDSWEEIDEERLSDGLSKLSNRDSNLPSGSDESSQSGGGTSNSTLTAMLDEELRPRMILQRPQMQILRRPQSQTQEEKAAAEVKPKTQIKSLDQRKQAYAEARLRILGSAHDEEEQQQKQIEQAPKKGSPNTTNGYRINNNNSTSNNTGGNIRLDRPPNSFRPPLGTFHMQQHPSQHPGPSPFYPPHPSGRNHLPPEATSSINHHYYQQQQQQGGPHIPGGYHFQHHQQHPHQKQQQLSPYGMSLQSSTGYHHHGLGGPMPAYSGPLGGHNSNNNVLRMPAGPDGSHGFTIRR